MKILTGILLTLFTTITFAGINYWIHVKNDMLVPATLTAFNQYCIYSVVPSQVELPAGKVTTFFVRTNSSGSCHQIHGYKNQARIGLFAFAKENYITFSLYQSFFSKVSVENRSDGNFQYPRKIKGETCNSKGNPCIVLKEIEASK